MIIKSTVAIASLLASSLVVASSAPAQAFSFTTNLDPSSTDPSGDMRLTSVTYADGTEFSDFAYVNRVEVLSNDVHTRGNEGAASADRGRNTTTGVNVEHISNDNAGDLVTNLNNNNLNNIVDGEDRGSFRMNFFFDSLVDNIFVWERGMNSRLGVQAIDRSGNLLGDFLKLDSRNFDNAGFSINTMEIGNSVQRVGSLGVSLADLGVLDAAIAGIQVSAERGYRGPDFKVAGASTEAVPEPATMLATGLVAGGFAWARRRKAQQTA
jgi:hypothetical protein